ncbi:MAG: hypothetical protein KF815_12975 [Rhodospirillales bacterium]|nr:hypothetical protein [Rhodospirillales bacterium]
MKRLSVLGVCGVVALTAASGCVGPSNIYDRAQSHFDFPNSNVKPVGHVRSEVSKTTLFSPAINDPAMEQQAVRDALNQKNADILIDGIYEWTSRSAFILYFTKLTVEGEAATMEDIGRQKRQ